MPPLSQSLDPQVRIWLALALVSLATIALATCMLLLMRWHRRSRRRRLEKSAHRGPRPLPDPWAESARRLRVNPAENPGDDLPS